MLSKKEKYGVDFSLQVSMQLNAYVSYQNNIFERKN